MLPFKVPLIATSIITPTSVITPVSVTTGVSTRREATTLGG
jgi:hypothetical protein